jgi:hypothetical protein
MIWCGIQGEQTMDSHRKQVIKTLEAFVHGEDSVEKKAILLCELVRKLNSKLNGDLWDTSIDEDDSAKIDLLERQLFFASGRNLGIVLRAIDECLECVTLPENKKIMDLIGYVRRGIDRFFQS